MILDGSEVVVDHGTISSYVGIFQPGNMEIIAIVGETGPPQAFWPTPTIESMISHGAMNQTAVKPTRTISSQRSVCIFWAYLVVVVMVLVMVLVVMVLVVVVPMVVVMAVVIMVVVMPVVCVNDTGSQ